MPIDAISTTKLKNGWTVLEYEDPGMNVFVEDDALGPGATLGDLVAHRQRMRRAGVVSLDEKRGLHDPMQAS